ncbi:hypothetical protein HDU92_004488 [Lobulomyces angularis]|nr:hypothetical protein HDU92_004488 [Lobulomyces angularis]
MSSHDLLELHSSVVAKKYGIPTYLEVPFITSLSEVKRLIKDNINKRALMNATKSTQSSTALINEYKKSHKCYYPVKLERSFSKAYNAIVNAADQTMFDTLLQLERTYAQTVETIRNEKQKELDDLKIRQMFELQRVDESDVNMKIYFKDKHLEELIVLERKLRTEVVEVYASQKIEYRDFVNKVYEELITREAESNQKSPQKTEVTEPGVLRLKRNSFINVGETSQEGISISALKKLDKKPSMEMLAALCNNNDVERQENTNSFPVIEQIPNSDQEFANMIANIQEMGFSFEQAEASLDLSSKNLQAAINLLLEKSNVVDRHIPVVRQKKEKHKKIYSDGDFGKRRYPEALKKSSSMLKLRSNSTDSFNSNSSTPPDSPSSKRAFSARSYLQQQQQLQQHKSLSSSNSNNSQTKTLKKMTSFLGKAMEALGLEDSEVRATVKGEIAKLSSNDEYLSESFTIYLGTQVRTMYNLRLIASKSYSDIFTLKLQSPEQELALRAQTANSLYMHDLSGVIVFLTKEDFKMYAKGFSANKGNMF